LIRHDTSQRARPAGVSAAQLLYRCKIVGALYCLFAAPPTIETMDVLAAKLPQ
jgi:hypothetical protein